jgi:hypothetical protein
MNTYGINATLAVNSHPFTWNGKDGELKVETTGLVKLQHWVRTKYVDIPNASLSGDGSLVFETTSTKLQVVVTGATSEVVVTPFNRA